MEIRAKLDSVLKKIPIDPETSRLSVGLALLAVVYFLLDYVTRFLLLSEDTYSMRALLPGILRNPFSIFLIFLTLVLVFFDNFRLPAINLTNRLKWRNFKLPGLRVYVSFLALLLMWVYSLYPFNFYFGEWHSLDRLLVLILGVGVFFYAPLVIPLVAYSLVMVGQFQYPEVLLYTNTDKKMLFDFVLLFAAFLPIKLFFKEKEKTILFGFMALFGSYYLAPALQKLSLGVAPLDWVLQNNLGNLFLSSIHYGWLAALPSPAITAIASLVSTLAVPLQLFTIVTELLPSMSILDRRLAYFSLAGAFLLHLGIFLSSGIFFWKWMLVDLGLLLLLVYNRKHEIVRSIFNLKNFAIFLPILLVSPFLFRTFSLGWWDSKLVNFYSFEVIAEDGNLYHLAPGFFEPYDLPFAQSRFFFLNEDKILVNTYGVQSDREIWADIMSANSPQEIENAIARLGTNYYDRNKTSEFKQFLATWFHNYNATVGGDRNLQLPSAPHHIIAAASEPVFPGDLEIMEVRVRFTKIFFDDDVDYILEDKIIAVVSIP